MSLFLEEFAAGLNKKRSKEVPHVAFYVNDKTECVFYIEIEYPETLYCSKIFWETLTKNKGTSYAEITQILKMLMVKKFKIYNIKSIRLFNINIPDDIEPLSFKTPPPFKITLPKDSVYAIYQ